MLSDAQLLYYAWDISHRKSATDDSRFTGVLSEAKVALNPHQIEAALFAFNSPLSKGAILADEVGLGKTIEAGIILSELWAEHKRHILIIVPASLRNQWSTELYEKFYLPSMVLERGSYENLKCRNAEPFSINDFIIICSYNFAFSYAHEISNVHWDLIVFDEAHKLRNVYKKENVTANTLKEALKPYKKLLLTATPLQNNLKELYGLISIIDDEFFASVKSFDEQYNKVTTRDNSKYGELKARISHIAHRTLRSQVQEYVNYTKRTAFVQEYTPSDVELELYRKVTIYLLAGSTFGVHEKIRPLLSMLIWKIMSSSAYALRFTLAQIISRLQALKEGNCKFPDLSEVLSDVDESKEEEIDDDCIQLQLNENDFKIIDREINELNECIRLASCITHETKALELIKGLDKAFLRLDILGANKKALVFTESCRTQQYLYRFLQENGYKGRVVCFNGTNNDSDVKAIFDKWIVQNRGTQKYTGNVLVDKKQAIVDYFKDSADILISTEAGAEGINLQFCSLVVNYDMPWNPQRVEQRIGRCHRYGQKHDVVVMNFVNKKNAADCRVYQLLNDKFKLFDGVFGSSDEILGSMDSALSLEKRIYSIYQTCRTEEEINAAFDKLQAELQDVIYDRVLNTKKAILENFDEDVVNKLKVRQEKDINRINKYITHFWEITKHVLGPYISNIDEKYFSFTIKESLGDLFVAGEYSLDKNEDSKLLVRTITPTGQFIINQAKNISPREQYVEFNLSEYPLKIKLLEEYIEQEGWLAVYVVKTENEYDSCENLIFCPLTVDGSQLPEDFGVKLLELPTIGTEDVKIPNEINEKFEAFYKTLEEDYKSCVQKKAENYANYEIEKFEAWANDQIVPVQDEVIALRKEKDSIHKLIRKEHNVKAKLELQRKELDLSSKMKKKQLQLFKMQDDYEKKVDEITKKLLASLENNLESTVMFKLKWKIK